jgi:transcriptional regulator GlxA family with amidase domain
MIEWQEDKRYIQRGNIRTSDEVYDGLDMMHAYLRERTMKKLWRELLNLMMYLTVEIPSDVAG